MFSFEFQRNNRPEIGYPFIFPIHSMLLMLTLFLMIIIFPERTLAQFGKITGHVYRYTNNSPMNNVTVVALNEMNEQRGSDTTNANGYYEIEELVDDAYRVCARKDGYVIECYQKPDPLDPVCTDNIDEDCGFYWIEDPTKTLGSFVKVTPPHTTPNINFYLTRGGKIEGNISGVLEESPDPNMWSIDYKVFLSGEIEYKNKEPVPWELPLNIDSDNHFSNSLVIPPGKYVLWAKDFSYLTNGLPLPYYYTVYCDENDGTYIQKNARNFIYLLDQPTNLTADFSLRRGGIIKGFVKEFFLGKYIGINKILTTCIENTLTDIENPGNPFGFTRSTETRTITYQDTNSTGSFNGFFSLTGLPPGSYILKADDTSITDTNRQIYLPRYYNNVYFEDEATMITISEEDIINDPYYQGVHAEIVLQHGPVIKGWAIEYDPALCSSAQYDSKKALDGITIELIPNFRSIPQEPPRRITTDPNGRYNFLKTDKILPGSFKIRAIDTNINFYPTDYQTITITPAATYEVNFCMKRVPSGLGHGNLSGHIFLDENPDHPLPGITIGALDKISGEFQDSITNNNGEYFFNDLEPGEYILFTTEKYGDLIHELYKDVSILDPNKFDEGSIIVGTFLTEATDIFLLPGENRTNVNIGLSVYQYTFRSGLNLFGYPGLPVEIYNDSHKFCRKLGTAMHNFKWMDPSSGQWEVTRRNLLDPNQPLGDRIDIHTGRGFLIYMYNNRGPIFFPPFKIQPPSVYQMVPGKNFIAYPSSLHRPIKRSSELLKAFGRPNEVASVQSFDSTSGKWKSTVWVWDKPGAADFPIVQSEGYIVEMRSYNTVETEPPYITP